MAVTRPDAGPVPTTPEAVSATAEAVSAQLAVTVRDRDREGGTPKPQRDLLRASGLLAIAIPVAWGGGGASWSTIAGSIRTIARADGSLAHVYGFQHLLLATVRLFGSHAQWQRLATATAAHRWFWGNALNPLDDRARLQRRGDHHVLSGEKSFCSGARDADVLVVSGIDDATGKLAVAAIPGDRHGIVARADWDSMGQRQTDSGSVGFLDVVIEDDELLTTPGPLGSPFATLRPCIAQLSLANIYLGIAEGALASALEFTRGRKRGDDDPFVLATLGDLHVELEAARRLTDAAAIALDAAWSRGDDITPADRGEAAIAIAAAKVVTTRTGLDVTTRIFDATGARGATSRGALDRYWRDLRTHTLHDPVDHKRRDIGRWLLRGQWPQPSFYS